MIENRSYKKNLLYITLFFIFSVLISFVLIEKYFLENEFKKQILKSSYEDISKKERYIYTLIENTNKTLKYIYNLKVFKEGIENESFQEITNIFYTISQSNIYFMQLRYIDKNGLEKIRIDRVQQSINPVIVKQNSLQDKSHRTYFKEATRNKDIFVSKLDLNKENNKIEFPYKPTIRVVLPIYKKNSFEGMIIANIEVNLLIDSKLFDMMISNEQGDVILPFETNKKRFKKRLKNIFPNDTKNITTNDVFIGKDYISYNLDTQIKNNIIFIAKLKKEYFEKFQEDQMKTRISIFFLLLLFISGISLYFIKKIDNIIFKYHKSKLEDKRNLASHELKSTNNLILQNIQPELIISQAKTSMLLTDENCNIIYANSAFEKLFDYKIDEFIGKNPRFLNQEDREQTGLEKLRNCIEKQKAVTVVLRNYTKDDELKYIELSISPIFDKQTNDLKYFLGVHKDVTREQKIIQDLRKIF